MDKLLATELGLKLLLSITSKTRFLISSLTGFESFKTLETVAFDTPACLAISLMVIFMLTSKLY